MKEKDEAALSALRRWLLKGNYSEFKKVASLLKTSSMDVRRANAEWKDVLNECWKCERAKDDIEFVSDGKSDDPWIEENAERFAELKNKFYGKNPIDLCDLKHDQVIDGMGMHIGSELAEDYVNLSNRNARKLFNILGFYIDEHVLEIPAEDVSNVIRKINRLLNLPDEIAKHVVPPSDTRRESRVMKERDDGTFDISVQRGARMIDSGLSDEYLSDRLHSIREIFIAAADKDDGVIVI